MTNNRILLLLLFLALRVPAQASAAFQWEKSFGGTNADVVHAIKATVEGGFLLGGYSSSTVSGTKSSASFGSGDFWLVKLDGAGVRQWDRSFGGTNFDGAIALQQTSDGGFILGGVSYSEPSGNKTTAHYGDGDGWLLKLDAAGNKQWEKSFGGSSNDVLKAVQPTSDGGYILGGTSRSGISGNKSTASQGSADYWLIKVDASGNKQWERSLGGSDLDELQSAQQTADGGYLVAGYSFSGISGNKTAANLGAGLSDFWVIKLDAGGNKLWEKSLGGTDADELRTARQTTDGGYLLAGTSYSRPSGNKTSPNQGAHDYWLVKLDAGGSKQWEKSYGGLDSDELHSAEQTADGGFIVGGVSASGLSGNKLSANTNSPGRDYWMLKLDASGDKQWEQSLEANWSDGPASLCATASGYIVSGVSASILSPDLDFSVAKLMPSSRLLSYALQPNGAFHATASGMPGTNYVLQASTNLVNWTPVRTNTAAAQGVVSFVVTGQPSAPKRFYRVRQQ